MSPAKYREDLWEMLKEHYKDRIDVALGKMFGHPGVKIEGRFFATLMEDGIIFKFPREVYDRLLEMETSEPFAPHGTPMSTWLKITLPDAEDYLQNGDWFDSALEYTRTEALKEDATPSKKTSPKKRAKSTKRPTRVNSVNKETYSFLADLGVNNDKTWFEMNRKRYELHLKNPLKALSIALSEPIRTILPEFDGKAKISRINNDLRFHKDRPPYKTHMWISFGQRNAPVDIFFEVDQEGWSVGCGIEHPKKEMMYHWRRNLIEHSELWTHYVDTLVQHNTINEYIQVGYKNPLFSDTPQSMELMVQSKSVWFLIGPQDEFKGIPEQEIFTQLCAVLPLYYFMKLETGQLMESITGLGTELSPPNQYVRELWSSLSRHL